MSKNHVLLEENMESQNAETEFQRFRKFKLPYRESETKLICKICGENKVSHSRGSSLENGLPKTTSRIPSANDAKYGCVC